MKKYILIGGILFLIACIFVIIYIFNSDDIPINAGEKINDKSYQSTPSVMINYENLPKYLSSNAVVKDLPSDSKVLLRFYNFDNGVREWEKSFVLTKGNVKEGMVDDADLILIIHSKYLDEWNNKNFCTIMKKANQNGDLGYESDLSSVSLAWKFKSLNKHKSCFGI